MTVDGTRVYSEEVGVEVQFPKLDDFKDNASLMTAFNDMWLSTLNATTSTSRYEQGCYITLDTATGSYGVTPVPSITGREVPKNEGATINLLPIPSDIPPIPSPTDTVIYIVGHFHTHTPATWIECDPSERLVGPSDPDYKFARENGLPGLVYDYIAVSNGGIPAGHPLNEPAKLYPIVFPWGGTVLERRVTP
jgi:hypothetical protein